MASLLYTEGWLMVALALAASFACARNAKRIRNAKRFIRLALSTICLLAAIILTLGLLRVVDGTVTLAWLLGCLAALFLSLSAREIIESPAGREH